MEFTNPVMVGNAVFQLNNYTDVPLNYLWTLYTDYGFYLRFVLPRAPDDLIGLNNLLVNHGFEPIRRGKTYFGESRVKELNYKILANHLPTPSLIEWVNDGVNGIYISSNTRGRFVSVFDNEQTLEQIKYYNNL